MNVKVKVTRNRKSKNKIKMKIKMKVKRNGRLKRKRERASASAGDGGREGNGGRMVFHPFPLACQFWAAALQIFKSWFYVLRCPLYSEPQSSPRGVYLP